jgi:hypothetical protein
MSVESDLVAACLGNVALAALIGNRMVPDKMTQAGSRPFIVYVVKRTPEYNLLTTLCEFAAQVWADDRQSADSVTDAFVTALAAATSVEAGGVTYDERDVIADHDLDLEGNEVTFSVWRDA